MTQKQIKKLKKLGFSETNCKGQYAHKNGYVIVYDDEEENKKMHFHKTLKNPIQISGQFYPLKKDLTDKDILEIMHNITILILEVRKIVNSKK